MTAMNRLSVRQFWRASLRRWPVPLTLALTVSLLVAAPANAVPVTLTTTASTPLQRPDSTSAMTTARVTGQQVEDMSQRSEDTRVYANPNGTWSAEAAAGPTSVQDAQGAWHDIDTTLVQKDGGWAPAYAATDVVLSAGGNSIFASLTDSGKQLNWRWQGTLPAPVIDGNVATYPDVIPGGDLVVTVTPTGFTHNIVLRQAPTGPISFTIPVATHGADLTQDASGGLQIATGKAGVIAAAPQPVMWDATENAAGDHEHVAVVDTTVGQTANGTPTVVLTPNDSFLIDPSTVYPVTIDPSFTTSATGDVWVENPNYLTGQVSSEELRVGTYDGGGHVARAFMHFNGGNSTWNGKDILSADLILRNYYSGSCTGSEIDAKRITSGWNGNTLTWSNKPSGTNFNMATYNPAHGYNSSCAAANADWNVTGIVQQWANGTTNDGIMLRAADETSIYSWRRYRSADYTAHPALEPKIQVTYNSYPNKPTGLSVSPGNSGYSTSTGPKLKATVSDPDGGTVRANFEVYQGSTLKWSGSSSYVNSGSTASKTIPSGTLVNGTTYTVKAKAYDGTDTSKSYSSSVTFTVDTSKPSTTVTSTAFTNGQWTTTAPSSNSFTFSGPSDTKSFTFSEDGVQMPSVTASSGSATVSWLPADGSHTLSVSAMDTAGNVGPTASFGFGVGPASFLAPATSGRSTAVFPIEISGPPGATGATLSWRYNGEDSSSWRDLTGVTTTSGAAWDPSSLQTDPNTGASVTGRLLWDATQQADPTKTGTPQPTIAAPALIELRACFTYSGAPSQVCSNPRQVQLVPSAFGGNFPTTQAGPATIALTTGEMTATEPDAVDTYAGVGRTFSSYDASTTTGGVFGPGWSTSLLAYGDTDAQLLDRRATDRTFVLVTAGNASQTFVPADPNITDAALLNPSGQVEFQPAGTDDGSRLVLDGSTSTPTVTLTRQLSTVTTWVPTLDGSGNPVLDTDGNPEWSVQSAATSQVNSGDTQASFDYTGTDLTWVAQTAPGVSATCTAAVQDPGCRGLSLAYTGTGTDKRLAQVTLVTAGAADVAVATYTYNGQGLLSSVCGPDPDGSGPEQPLCSSYTYDTTTVAGRTLLASMTPPDQEPWLFHYDSTGRITSVTRPLDPNTNTGSGPATWIIDYALTTGAGGLPAMGATDVAQWGQDVTPTAVYAVWGPNHVPSATPTSGDLAYAQLWYTDSDGSITNTAVHGNADGVSQWLVDTLWYDQYGNVVRSLDGAGRARALAAAPADQLDVATQASSFTDYNKAGTRVEDQYGPAVQSSLKDGTSGLFRSHTHYIYDDATSNLGGTDANYPNGVTTYNLVVEADHSASDADMTGTPHDETVVRNYYDPIVTGDASGWTLGTPTMTETQLADGSWSKQVTRYDSQGRQIASRQASTGALPTQQGTDAHSTLFAYYDPNSSDTDCKSGSNGIPAAWQGLLCKTGPANAFTDSSAALPYTYDKTYDDDLQPTKVEQVHLNPDNSTSVLRTATTSYDVLGRTISVKIDDGTNSRTTTTSYDYTANGQPETTVSVGTDTVSTTYDNWGRPWMYTDATGMISTYTYTVDGQPATVNDGQGTYTYSYDTAAGEHRRLPSTVQLGLSGGQADTFALTYDAAGAVTTATYPNGLVAQYTRNEAGVPVGLDYSDGSGNTLLSFTNTTDVDGRVLTASSAESDQAYSYDNLGRLTQVQDNRNDPVAAQTECTTRTYGFSDASLRTSVASYAPAADGSCQTTTAAVTKTNSYNAANQITNSGYTYDTLGRTTATPASDTAAGATGQLNATYYVNDMVKHLDQTVDNGAGGSNTLTNDYGLDPTGRVNQITSTVNGTETQRLRYRFSDNSDSPTNIQASADGGTTWTTTRYLTVPGLGMIAADDSQGVTYQLANLHGDVVATQAGNQGTLAIDSYSETDEYGNPIDPSIGRYGYLGTHQRSTDTIGGITLMGARLYNPVTGLFLSADPVINGGANRYSYPCDPVGGTDLTGRFWSPDWHVVGYAFSPWMPSWRARRLGREFMSVAHHLEIVSDPLEYVLQAATMVTAARAFVFMHDLTELVKTTAREFLRLGAVGVAMTAVKYMAGWLDAIGRAMVNASWGSSRVRFMEKLEVWGPFGRQDFYAVGGGGYVCHIPFYIGDWPYANL